MSRNGAWLTWYSDSEDDDYYKTYNDECNVREPTYAEEIRSNSKLYIAVKYKDLDSIKLLDLDLDKEIKLLTPCLDETLIHLAVKRNSYEIVEYLLNLNKIDINATGFRGETALFRAVQEENLELLKLLIERGADVNIPNFVGETPLFYVAQEENLEFLKLLIERGADVNILKSNGETPLLKATIYDRLENCKILLENGADVNLPQSRFGSVLSIALSENRDVEWVAMFMCYGADMFANCIYRYKVQVDPIQYYEGACRSTPFEMSLILPNVEAQEIFFDFIINENLRMPFNLLLKSMTSNCEFFPNLIDKVDFIVNYKQMVRFIKTMFECTPEYLKLFLENHHNLLTILNRSDFHVEVNILAKLCNYVGKKNEGNYPPTSRIMEYFYIIFKEPWASLFIDNVNFNLEKFSMSDMFRLLRASGIEVNQIEEMIFHLLSFGMDLTDRDFDEFYLFFGDGPFFKTLLHMEIIETESFQPRSYFPTLIYNINVNIDKFFNKSLDDSSLEKLLDLFANKEIKDLCFNANNEELIAKMKNLPNVPSLLQLSRDVARKHIINAFCIKTSQQFYTILKNLPIQDDYKSIISYEMKIY